MRDITNVKCKIYTLSSDAAICTDEYASKIMQRFVVVHLIYFSYFLKGRIDYLSDYLKS